MKLHVLGFGLIFLALSCQSTSNTVSSGHVDHVVLMWLTPSQAMVYNEATGNASWTASAPATVSGRPGCTALPLAVKTDEPKMALGCIGMRTFTGIGDDRLLAAVPGDKIEELTAAVEAAVTANAGMRSFYEGHKAQFA